MLLFESQGACRFLSLTHDLNFTAFVSEIVEHQLAARLSLCENPACNADFDIFEVLPSLDMLVLRYETAYSFVMWGIGSMNVEIGGAMELAGCARSNLGVLLHVEDQGLATFPARI